MTNNRQKPYDRFAEALDSQEEVPCQIAPDVFFPEDIRRPKDREEAIRIAKLLCASCPIQMACFEYAIVSKERFGIWAGTLPSDR
mgnify:CR=1 FL=1